MNTIKPRKKLFYFTLFFALPSFFLFLMILLIVVLNFPLFESLLTILLYVPLLVFFGYTIYQAIIFFRIKALHIFEDRFELEYSHKTKNILFNDILKLKVVNSMEGTYSITTAEGSIGIGPNQFEIKKMSLFTEALYRSRPDLLSAEDFLKVRALHLCFKDDHYKYGHCVALIPFLFAFVLYLFQAQLFIVPDFFQFYGSAVFTLVVIQWLPLTVVEFWFNRKSIQDLALKLKESSLGEYDIKALKLRKMKRIALLSALMLPYYVFVYKYDLNYLDYKEGHWVDERYGHAKKKKKIEKDHHVFFSRDYDGVIVAMPTESVSINRQKGRKLASEKLVQVPEDQFAVRSGEAVLLVKKQMIDGVVIKSFGDFF